MCSPVGKNCDGGVRMHYPPRGFFLLMCKLSIPGGGKQCHQLQLPPDPGRVPVITHS